MMTKRNILLSLLAAVAVIGCGKRCGENSNILNSTVTAADAAPAAVDTNVVFFPFDSSKLDSDAEAVVAEQAKNTAASVTVTGHASKEGTPAYNVGLGHRRANATADALKKAGYKGDVKTSSFGKSIVFVEGETEDMLKQNRRAMFWSDDKVELTGGKADYSKKAAHSKKRKSKKAKKAQVSEMPAVAAAEMPAADAVAPEATADAAPAVATA